MIRAIELSAQSVESGGGPFGSVIVKDGQIIAESANRVTIDNDPTAHAEVNAIRLACQKLQTYSLEGCEIYTSCEPCPMCLAAIYWARIGKIYFANTKNDAAAIGFDDSFIYHEIQLPHDKRSISIQPFMRDEAWKVFKKWEEKEDKREY